MKNPLSSFFIIQAKFSAGMGSNTIKYGIKSFITEILYGFIFSDDSVRMKE